VTNEWLTLVRAISNGQPVGVVCVVSQTNSVLPYPTACSFGTNYLALWSTAIGPILGGYCAGASAGTDLYFAMVDGRMLTPAAEPAGNSFAVIRSSNANTNLAVAFTSGRYLVSAGSADLSFTLASMRQPLAADGSRVQQPLWPQTPSIPWPHHRMAAGVGRFCVVEWYFYPSNYFGPADQRVRAIIYAPEFQPELSLNLTDFQRINRGITPSGFYPYSEFEYTTNLVTWTPIFFYQLSTLTNFTQLYVRLKDGRWICTDNLRAISQAKQRWTLENQQCNSSTPRPTDLFGLGRYLPEAPVCPGAGTYSINTVGTRPTCLIPAHTL
jgi:hypothetical protein